MLLILRNLFGETQKCLPPLINCFKNIKYYGRILTLTGIENFVLSINKSFSSLVKVSLVDLQEENNSRPLQIQNNIFTQTQTKP